MNAVLFDYDGVVANTMVDNCRAWKRAFADFGVVITDEEYYALEGMSPSAIAKEIGVKRGLAGDSITHIPLKKAEYYRKENAFHIYPKIPLMLRQLKERGMKCALVSGAARHRIEEMTPKELLLLFDVVICAEDVDRPKPDPQPYQIALDQLRMAPDEAVVIENAPLGIQSAKAAGCYCIALETTLSKDKLMRADKILSTHEDLVHYFL